MAGIRHHTPLAATPRDELDRTLERLRSRAAAWASLDARARARYLRAAAAELVRVAPDWVAWAVREKGEDPAGPVAGEEWISGPMVTVRFIRLLAESLERARWDAPRAAPRPGGRSSVPVFPETLYERALYPGVSAEIWFGPGVPPSRGAPYRRGDPPAPPGVALVLGAGNVGSIAPLDALDQLFVHGRVAVVKMNPVNAYLGPLLGQAFRSLVGEGFLAFVFGGAEAGAYLARHELVDAVHLTGSAATFEALVWGATPEQRRRRKAAGRPLLDKPVTAELGCVTPVIVVPGRWTSEELRFQARRVAAMVAHNASFNCNAAKVLVLSRDWYLREAFVDALAEALRRIPPRRAYYPGARERYQRYLNAYPGALVLGDGDDSRLAWAVVPDVPPVAGEPALSEEAFCGVIAVCALDAGGTGDPEAFLDAAVRFANESIAGTLSCALLVDPRTERALGARLTEAVARLWYGGVGINLWPGVIFGLGTTTWGAFPGHTPESVGSGLGVVHNARLYDRPERSVARAPFVPPLTPPWFADFPGGARLGPRITRFEAAPSASALPGLLAAALWS
ncbi:MAG: aldehyde dehydrogenase family protein [Acidobacteria bacterium]|nr:MAG: aldehyde dehydrogenase family protein [Acidobacteriota bacterium]